MFIIGKPLDIFLCKIDWVLSSDFDLLRDHYRSNHYFCEIGQCKDVQFTNVFASEVDFRAHQAAQHSKNRAEARQLGTIPVEFQPTRRQAQDPAHRGLCQIFSLISMEVFLCNIQEHFEVVNLRLKEVITQQEMNGKENFLRTLSKT